MRHTNSIVVIASIINAIQGITQERMIAQIGKLSSAGAMGSQYRWMNGWMNNLIDGWIDGSIDVWMDE